MIVNKRFAKSLFKECLRTPTKCEIAKIHNRGRIGNRDWVGFGKSGMANYEDSLLYPFPAIRFKENTNELFALREKEKGDWRKLSIEEKKILYRASFRQTITEHIAPTGQWKQQLAMAFCGVSVGFWLMFLMKQFVYDPLPETFSEENRKMALRRMIDLKIGHLNGPAAKWDYENDDWKK